MHQVGTQEEGCAADDVSCGYRLCYCPGINDCHSACAECGSHFSHVSHVSHFSHFSHSLFIICILFLFSFYILFQLRLQLLKELHQVPMARPTPILQERNLLRREKPSTDFGITSSRSIDFGSESLSCRKYSKVLVLNLSSLFLLQSCSVHVLPAHACIFVPSYPWNLHLLRQTYSVWHAWYR